MRLPTAPGSAKQSIAAPRNLPPRAPVIEPNALYQLSDPGGRLVGARSIITHEEDRFTLHLGAHWGGVKQGFAAVRRGGFISYLLAHQSASITDTFSVDAVVSMEAARLADMSRATVGRVAFTDLGEVGRISQADYRSGRRLLLDSAFADRYARKLQLRDDARDAIRPMAEFRAVANGRFRITFPTHAGRLRADWGPVPGDEPFKRRGAFNAKAILYVIHMAPTGGQ